MGVKDLWPIIDNAGQLKDLSEFNGKNIAIDLNTWVMTCKNETMPYLENIFYKTIALLEAGATLIFVLEGKEPEIKLVKLGWDRNDRNCIEMLQYMGCSSIEAQGQAESMCAHLNAKGFVDGCITTDGDCFLYGAETVYRNYTVNGAKKYTMTEIQNVSKIGRNEMIALALLCGCDYGKGINGVGRETAMKLIEVAGAEILEKLRKWKDEEFICTNCGHSGSVEIHSESGCSNCGTNPSCNKEPSRGIILSKIKTLRQKVMELEEFPREAVIGEFLGGSDERNPDIQWYTPQIAQFRIFMKKIDTEPEKIQSMSSRLDKAWRKLKKKSVTQRPNASQ